MPPSPDLAVSQLNAHLSGWAAFAAAFATVAVAELGDRTQLALLAVASEVPRPWTLFWGASLAFALTNALAVSAGALVASVLPAGVLDLVAAGLFAAFGSVFAARAVRQARRRARGLSDPDLSGDDDIRLRSSGALLLGTAATIFLAETGDKTQIATAVLAASAPPVPVLLGATAALVANAALAVYLGRKLAGLPPRLRGWLTPLAAVLFLAFAVVALWRGLHALGG